MLEKKSVVSVKCLDIMSDQNVKLAGHIQNLVGQCPMTDCYFQLCGLQFFFPYLPLSYLTGLQSIIIGMAEIMCWLT